MPVVQQEIHAVLFELYRIGSVIGDALDHFDRGDLNFESAGRALIGVNSPGDDHARLLREAAQSLECSGLVLQRYQDQPGRKGTADRGERIVEGPTDQLGCLGDLESDRPGRRGWHGTSIGAQSFDAYSSEPAPMLTVVARGDRGLR
jgi:hypothetical protein